jgi:hypothetical protein
MMRAVMRRQLQALDRGALTLRKAFRAKTWEHRNEFLPSTGMVTISDVGSHSGGIGCDAGFEAN